MRFVTQDNSITGDPFIAQQLQARIEAGEYGSGSWLPAERALAEEFGAERYTIRKALARLEAQGLIVREPGRRPWVCVGPPPPTGERQPMTSERSLQTIIAILGQNATNLNSSAILRGIGAALQSKEAPYRLLVSDTFDPDPATVVTLERNALGIVGQDGVAGAVVVHNGGEGTLSSLLDLQERGLPLVFLDRFPEGMRCDFVGVDNFASAQEAVQHLIGLGHRRIAHLTTQETVTTLVWREEGYREALREAGIAPRANWVYRAAPQTTQADLAPALDHFLALPEAPTALFAANDILAHYFIAESEARGRKVPDTISVIGFDNYDRYSPRPAVLTTVDQSFEQMGRRAAEMLLQRLAHPGPSPLPYQHILLPTRLVVRATTRPPAD